LPVQEPISTLEVIMNLLDIIAKNSRVYPDESAFVELKPVTKARKEISWRRFEERVNKIANAHKDTGDLGRMDGEGFVYIVDRKKDLAISGGENIYPVEIEATLLKHPKVRDVAVIGSPDDRLGEVVTAIIEPKEGDLLTKEEATSFCEETPPRYKRPRSIFFDHVPRSPSGKIEKPKLREKYRKPKMKGTSKNQILELL